MHFFFGFLLTVFYKYKTPVSLLCFWVTWGAGLLTVLCITFFLMAFYMSASHQHYYMYFHWDADVVVGVDHVINRGACKP